MAKASPTVSILVTTTTIILPASLSCKTKKVELLRLIWPLSAVALLDAETPAGCALDRARYASPGGETPLSHEASGPPGRTLDLAP
jgi:hypothetical protein